MGIRAALWVHPSAHRLATAVADRLRPALDHLELVEAGTVERARGTLAAARDRGLDVLVVLGGDGSAHQGVQLCAGTDLAFGVVPAGTGNDLARALGTPEQTLAAADAVASALRSGARRTLDLGRVVGDGNVSEPSRWFATVLCAGFDSAVNERANRMRWPRGHRRYDLATVAELAALRPHSMVIRAGSEHIEVAATLVSVGNTPFYGGGVPICPAADPTDGLLDVTILGRVSRLTLLRMVPGMRSGRHIDHPAVTTLRAGSVHLGGPHGLVAYADGERIGPLPLEITSVPAALTVIG